MKSIFVYSSKNQLHGILRSFYDQNNEIYQQNLEYSATSSFFRDTLGLLSPDHAFDFNGSDGLYWYGNYEQEGLVNLSFCLPNYYVKLSGFELQTYHGDARPESFGFSSSIENFSYTHYQTFSEDFTTNVHHYFKYKSPISKCFRLTCINSTLSTKAFDVDHIEIYGEIHPLLSQFFPTCHHNFRFHIYHMIYFLISK